MAVVCPSCRVENAADARRCSSCGGKLAGPAPRRRRRGGDDENGTTLGGSATLTAWRCTAWGLIPGFGLVLGPAGVILALRAYRQEKAGPSPKGMSPALAVLLFAAAVLVTSWVGVLLMIYGLTSTR
jgi:hypothetical protein